MNIERIKAAIEMMKQAKNLGMKAWQSVDDSLVMATSIEELHKCGNTACFAGYLAISDEFKEAGGCSGYSGQPMFKRDIGCDFQLSAHGVVAEYFDISYQLAKALVYGELEPTAGYGRPRPTAYSYFYQKGWDKVTAQDVIYKLELILEGKLK